MISDHYILFYVKVIKKRVMYLHYLLLFSYRKIAEDGRKDFSIRN